MSDELQPAEAQARLSAPFDPAEVDFRPSDFGSKAVAFIDGEAVIRRLNAVFGPLNWSFDWDPIVVSAAAPRKKGGEALPHDVVWVVKGRLMAGGGVHTDVGDADANETTKAAVTDALKRCATQLGIGLYLRSLPPLAATVSEYAIPDDEKARLRRYLTIWHLLPESGFTEAEICTSLKVDRLTHLPEARALKLITRLRGGPAEAAAAEEPAADPPASGPPSARQEVIAAPAGTAPSSSASADPEGFPEPAAIRDLQLKQIRALLPRLGKSEADYEAVNLRGRALTSLSAVEAQKVLDWCQAQIKKKGRVPA